MKRKYKREEENENKMTKEKGKISLTPMLTHTDFCLQGEEDEPGSGGKNHMVGAPGGNENLCFFFFSFLYISLFICVY